ncbi:putative RecA/RadA family phage recombinase [Ancylobacter sp. 3268]|uniref:DUF2190 family protein n=1 Tax=Ancylobacter sp. 3268 TaxID=2817752 RepID=UPI00285827BA|nr:DUF2190 family protein [Ancylobacter sp. 3268]MDR6954130.1 putative RecA/RadA family phage recombinase [Ancylobacter sp. 3268]
MKNYVQPGKTLTLPAPTGGVIGGKFYKIGGIFGVAVYSANEGELFDLETGGVYDLDKTSAEAWTVGATIYATAAGVMTTTATSNTKVGVATAAAANPSATGRVRLNSDF